MELQVGKRIKEQRKFLNLTQEDLATNVGVSVPAVSKWENGSSYPDITLLIPISRILNLSVDELLDNPKILSIEEIPILGNQVKTLFEQGDYLKGVDFCQKKIEENSHNLILQYHFAMLICNYLWKMINKLY